ncbi:hypothetical protein VNI00_003369 [Paramarasmius palmivorus]|uniref:Uncharacterized protein n=1 Tax=Paramarasmius palmivorus TaxID=297713 RepID=A0AAW0DUT2_9AGAR
MSKVATEEIAEDRKKQSLIDFYGLPSVEDLRAFDSGYSAQKHYRSFREWPTFEGHGNLTLYRSPPPYSVLETTSPPVSNAKADTATPKPAVLNKSHARMLAMADQQREAAAKRRRLSYDMAHAVFEGQSEAKSSPITDARGGNGLRGRNPFRKSTGSDKPSITSADAQMTPAKPTTQTGTAFMKASEISGTPKSLPTTSPATGSKPGHLSSSKADPASKSLKPISTIPVPELPEDEKRKLKEAAMKEEALIAKERAKFQASYQPEVAQADIRKMIKKVASSDSLTTKRRHSDDHGMPSGSKSKVAVVSGAVRKQSRNAAFDWKLWGKHS